jgi:hypothetical protein
MKSDSRAGSRSSPWSFWAGLTLDMRENVRSVGKLSDFGDCEIVGVGHGEPIPTVASRS